MRNRRHGSFAASLIAAFLCAVSFSPAAAKDASKNPPPPTYEWHDVKSANGSEYRIFVWTPKAPPPPPGYPVVYVLDPATPGAPLVADFVRVNETDNGFLSRVKPAIVVGIGYPIDSPFDLKRRGFDLTTPDEKIHSVIPDPNGGYEAFFSFIETVVKPEIERRYNIDRSQQSLLGHSLGGEFTLRTLVAHPQAYQNYVALSPSIWWADAALLQDAKAITPDAAAAAHTRVYLSAGELEEHMTPEFHAMELKDYREFAEANPKFREGRSVDEEVAILETHNRRTHMVDNARDMQFELMAKGYVVRFDSFPDEDHFSVVPAAIGRALPFVLKP